MIRMKHPEHGFHMALGIEVSDMKKHGWTEDMPEVVPELEKALVPVADDEDAVRNALIARADMLGVKVDKRWSDTRLVAEIEKAVLEQDAEEENEEE